MEMELQDCMLGTPVCCHVGLEQAQGEAQLFQQVRWCNEVPGAMAGLARQLQLHIAMQLKLLQWDLQVRGGSQVHGKHGRGCWAWQLVGCC